MFGITGKKLWVVLPVLFAIGIGAWLFMEKSADPRQDSEVLPDVVDYNYHIRPILSDRCYKCHGPDPKTREADLRLDNEEGAYKALKDDPKGHVIKPGDPLHSDLFLRVSTRDTSVLMPPPSSNLADTGR
jgi:hypothetical protein